MEKNSFESTYVLRSPTSTRAFAALGRAVAGAKDAAAAVAAPPPSRHRKPPRLVDTWPVDRPAVDGGGACGRSGWGDGGCCWYAHVDRFVPIAASSSTGRSCSRSIRPPSAAHAVSVLSTKGVSWQRKQRKW